MKWTWNLAAFVARQFGFAGFGALLALSSGCRKLAPPTTVPAPSSAVTWLADITEQAHIDFVHDAGPAGTYFFPQIMGSGAALFDYDNDGWLDIYLLNNGGPHGAPNQLYQQQPDGTFRNVSRGSGLDISGYCMGVAIGDVNNDGLPDVLVTEYGGCRLFLNQGNGRFSDVTREAGLEDSGWATGAAFFDFDRDGWLDLAVTHYVAYSQERKCTGPDGQPDYCGPHDFEGTVTRLYHNRGLSNSSSDRVPHFDDVTEKAGLGSPPSKGSGIVCADFTGDGWPDILVANDGMANHLWVNRHDGTFSNQAAGRGIAFNDLGQALGNMGIALADLAGTGLLDVYITHLTDEQDTLWRQDPPGMFRDETRAAQLPGSAGRATGFGTVFADFENSGRPGLAAVGGRVVRGHEPPRPASGGLPPYWANYAERNRIFGNEGGGKFTSIAAANPDFCAVPNVARGLAAGDVFNDGGTALLLTTVGDRARLFRDIAPRRGHWLTIRAIDPALGGRDAYGARITLTASGRKFVNWINPGSSYLSSNDPRAHFGLGNANHVDSLQVLWPDGSEENFILGVIDRVIAIHKGDGRRASKFEKNLPFRSTASPASRISNPANASDNSPVRSK